MSPKKAFGRSLQEFFKVPFTLLSITGLKLVYWDDNDRMSRGEKLGLCIMFFNIMTGLPLKANFLFNGTLETNLDIIALTIYWLFVINSMTKLGAIVIGRKKLNFVLKGMQATFPKTRAHFKDYKVEENFKDIHRYNVYLAVFHMLTTTMFNVFPLLQSILEYRETGQFSYRIPFMMKFPFDIRRPVIYSVAYLFQMEAGYNISLVFLGSDLVLITSVNLINMNFAYLKKKILDFEPTGTDEDIKELGKIMRFHEDILIYSVKIDEMFNISIFMNYFATGMVVCLLGYQVVAGTEILSLVKFCTFIFSTSAHIYLIASAGQCMTDLSMDVSDAFFHHPWYSAAVKYQRLLPLPIARAQRPAHLNAFKFFVISMESFKTQQEKQIDRKLESGVRTELSTASTASPAPMKKLLKFIKNEINA